MNEQEVLQILGKVGAVITDSHIVYTSGKHGSAYVNKDAIYPHTAETSRLCYAITKQFERDNVQAVIGPAIGGAIMSQPTAHFLSQLPPDFKEVLSVYAEKGGKTEFTPTMHKGNPFGLHGEQGFVIKRGYDKLIAGKNVLVVEDVLTTGGSVKKVVEAVRKCGGNIVGVGALCNRGGITAEDLGVPKLVALVNVTLDAYEEKDCPLCKQDIPINVDVGKGREFILKKVAEKAILQRR